MKIGCKKSHLFAIGIVMLLLAAALFLWIGDRDSVQAESPTIAGVSFAGEYRVGEGPWQEYVEGEHSPATRGDVTIRGCIPTHMEALTAKLLEMGVIVNEMDDAIRVRSVGVQHRAVNIKTQVYPGFPTDLQQPMSALLTTAKGESTVQETIYENRLRHLMEIGRMGAQVRIVDRTAIIDGVPELYGAPITAAVAQP